MQLFKSKVWTKQQPRFYFQQRTYIILSSHKQVNGEVNESVLGI